GGGGGGGWYEGGVGGSGGGWGRVLAYEPPTRFVLAWHLGTDWAFDPDPAHASEVEVLFTADGPNTTRVDLTHRHLERHGTGAEQMRAAVDSPDGWDKGLTRYAEAAGRERAARQDGAATRDIGGTVRPPARRPNRPWNGWSTDVEELSESWRPIVLIVALRVHAVVLGSLAWS